MRRTSSGQSGPPSVPRRSNWRKWLQQRWPALRHGVAAGVILGAAGGILSVLPPLWTLQEGFDLWALFGLRGPQSPSDDVALVTIDRHSAESISLPRDPAAYGRCSDLHVGSVPPTHQKMPPPHLAARWPRCVHERVLRAVSAVSPRLVVLDISFRPRAGASADDSRVDEAQDRALAREIASAGNVLVARRFDLVPRLDVGQAHARRDFVTTPSELSPAIDAAALGSAPFPLATGVFGRVDGFAIFGGTDTPSSSLPALAVHALLADFYADFARLLARASPRDAELLPPDAQSLRAWQPLQAHCLLIRNLLRTNPDIAQRMGELLDGPEGDTMPAQRRAGVHHLLSLYAGPAVRYFNLYGYPGSFTTLSYADVLGGGAAQKLAALRGKAVVIGFSELAEVQQDEHYPSVYTNNAGIKLSGAELLATAMANLMGERSVVPLAPLPRFLVTAVAGLGFMLMLLGLPGARGVVAALALALCYVISARAVFAHYALWLPLLVPVALQMPAGMIYGLAHQLLEANRKREEMRRLFGKFLPEEVIDGLLDKRAALDSVREPVYGVCMATDAERFTSLAENMHPAQLARYLDRYFEAVFPPITGHEGKISDITGDAVLAFWTDGETDARMHARAAGAALELLASVDQFNAASPGARLPTRVGIASGPMTTTAIGAFNHYEFRPVGDTVVTATRLQELNKVLGTRTIAAESAIHGLDGFLLRDLGTFLLRGKSVPTHVFEVVGERSSASGETLQLCLEFALALDALRSGRGEDALERFRRTRARYPQDGPTAFYVRWLSSNPPSDSGAIPQP
jgi:adenylate cyclase